jgi:hypothetical protein
MSTISLRLPDSLHKQIRLLAAQENVSINQLITLAVAEKVSALATADYLGARAQRGNRAMFEQAMAKVGQVPPEGYDVLPEVDGGETAV